jgi:MFS family permease
MDSSQLGPRVPELLRHQAFRRYWTAQTVSYMGDQVTLIALPLVAVLALHASAAQVGFLATAATLAPLLIGLHAGDWVDRVSRPRPVLIFADVARALLLASVPLTYAFGRLGMVQLYAIALLMGAAGVLFNVSAASVIPTLVPREQRVSGNALLRGSFSFSWVAGPSAGGALVGLLTAPVALAADGISFVASAALLRGLHIERRSAHEDTDRGVSSGLRFIATHPVLRAYLACNALLNFCYTTYFTLLIIFAARELHLSPSQIGLAISGGAIGALTGSFTSAPIARRLGIGRTLIGGATLYAAALLAIPFAPREDPWTACAIIAAAEFVSGFGLMLDDVNGLSLQQTITPQRMLSRVSGATLALTYGGRSLAGLVAGALGTALGLAPTITFAAALGVASTLILLSSPIRGIAELPEQAA